MIIETNVTTLTKEEIKALSFDTVNYDAVLASRMNKNKRIVKALTDEMDRIKDIAIENREKLENNKTVTVENRPSNTFDADEFISVYGEEEYKRFCEMKKRAMVKKAKYYVTFG